ncbi:hypothetical protein [Flavobacterium sp.]
MDKSATILLGLALTGIIVVATLQSDTKPETPKSEDKPESQPKKVVL